MDAVRTMFGEQRIDAVVHAAAALPDGTPNYFRTALSVNVQGTANLVSAASEAGCARFVYCSSVSVYGTTNDEGALFSETDLPSPEDVYAWSKWAGEEYVRLSCRKGDMMAPLCACQACRPRQAKRGFSLIWPWRRLEAIPS
ncbi:MAG: SDR family oxidoreductase [Betaproteobacteria bacterium]|uniref:SDR family oxidoreductase n=1 Tax=Candidatus Proximibacter danicus TaxID=2954365 RepID=A0A9D7JYV1_9PROT|nr:SDR family oxidoreductase [Candidatus Proximibacter danicus]